MIEETVYDSIAWALTKDRARLESIIAHDEDYFSFHPGGLDGVHGYAEFERGFELWMDPRFEATRTEVRKFRSRLSSSGDVAWFSAILDDCYRWDGEPGCWKDTRWTGVLEKRDGRWQIVQMHFSFCLRQRRPRHGRSRVRVDCGPHRKGTAMKTIGLVGGMTPESTKVYYEMLIRARESLAADPLRNPEILIYSLNLTELVHLQREGEPAGGRRVSRRHSRAPALGRRRGRGPDRQHPSRLSGRAPGRDLASPGEHRFRHKGRRLRQEVSRTHSSWEPEPPWRPKCTRREFAEAGIEIALPDEDDREFLDQTIYNELALGRVSPEVRQRFLGICTTHIERDGIDSVILGCTEIPLVISSNDLPIQVLDTTEIHVGAILAAAS